MPFEVRRVVTANDGKGRSYFLFDGPAQTVVGQVGRGLTFHELWETDGPVASNEGNEDAGARPVRHHPPVGGTRFRIVELLPQEEQSSEAVGRDFESIDASGFRWRDRRIQPCTATSPWTTTSSFRARSWRLPTGTKPC